MNIVDVLAIAPYFVTLIIFESMPEGEDNEGFNEIRRIVGVFRIMRILRVFKLARHSKGLQSIAYTLKTSYKELALLVLFMSMGVLVFASLVFFAEKGEEETPFVSIPVAFWWAIITMTTVGYGDMYPSSGIGMFLGKSNMFKEKASSSHILTFRCMHCCVWGARHCLARPHCGEQLCRVLQGHREERGVSEEKGGEAGQAEGGGGDQEADGRGGEGAHLGGESGFVKDAHNTSDKHKNWLKFFIAERRLDSPCHDNP